MRPLQSNMHGMETESVAPLIPARDVRRFSRDYAAGQTIFNAGDRGNCMYIVLEGTVRIKRTVAQREEKLSDLGPGEFFGEMALVDNSTRMASAVAVTTTRLAEIDRALFVYLVGQQPAFALTVMRVLAQRLARAQALSANMAASAPPDSPPAEQREQP